MRPPVPQEVHDEIAFHIEMTTRELIESGMTPTNARNEAARRFGDIDTVDAQCRKLATDRERRVRRAELHDEVRQDMRFAWRQLLRARTFTAIAVLTLALGIGATTTVFSALYAVVLQPLPFEHSERIVALSVSTKGEAESPSAAEFVALRDKVRAFQHVAATVLQTGFTITDGEVPELVAGGRVSASFFDTYGAKPEIGRVFTKEEDSPGRGNVVVLSYRAWNRRYNEDPAVLGRIIHLNGEAYSIIGVMPRRFDITPDGEELWVPLALTPAALAESSARYLSVVARLRPGVSPAQATSEATSVERATIAAFPDRRTPVNETGVQVTRKLDEMVGNYRTLLLILLGAVGFVLLIACTNVANLLLARGSVRAKELAIRVALGAARARLVRQLLTESLLLAGIGAALGLVFAYALLGVLLRVSPENVPRLEQARIDWHVIAFALVTALVSAIIAGLLPALRVAGPHLGGTLREGGRSSASNSGRLRQWLVAAQVALAMTLLTGSGLLLRSAWLVQHVNPGFIPDGVMTARIMLPEAHYESADAVVRAYDAMRREIAQVPGVASVAAVSVVPLSDSRMNASIFSDRQSSATDAPLSANLRLASPQYFATLGIPLRAGRDIATADDANAPPVVVLNEALARKLWPNETPASVIGRRVNSLSTKRAEPHWMTVVGIVGDIHNGALGKPAEPEFYAPVAQAPAMLWPFLQRSLVLVARAMNRRSAPELMTKPIARAVAKVDPSLAIAESRSMLAFLQGSLETARFNTLLLSTLGGIALALAMGGVYGVVAWFVAQRTHEIGVRMALGATPRAIWTHVLFQGLTPIIAGMVAGLFLSFITSGVLQGQLYEVGRGDPITLVAVGVVLLVVSVVATYVPARRAMRVSPVVALSGA